MSQALGEFRPVHPYTRGWTRMEEFFAASNGIDGAVRAFHFGADGLLETAVNPNFSGLLVATRSGGVTMAVGIQRNMGLLVLAIWLILYGLAGLVSLSLPAPLMAILALIAGVLILAGR